MSTPTAGVASLSTVATDQANCAKGSRTTTAASPPESPTESRGFPELLPLLATVLNPRHRQLWRRGGCAPVTSSLLEGPASWAAGCAVPNVEPGAQLLRWRTTRPRLAHPGRSSSWLGFSRGRTHRPAVSSSREPAVLWTAVKRRTASADGIGGMPAPGNPVPPETPPPRGSVVGPSWAVSCGKETREAPTTRRTKSPSPTVL